MPTLSAGQRLGAYEILGPLGAGGMGEVYRARDMRLDRPVAVKVLPPSVAESPDALARFEREARAVAALSHPNILAIYDFGQASNITYAVMELLEGETLRARLSAGALPPRKAVHVGVQVARALAAAHDRRIVHRDLKPENLFITSDGTVKVLDFGLARTVGAATAPGAVESVTVATEPGTVLGSVGYMAPEQVRGGEADHRADLFALGCVLFEMLTGRRAFGRDTPAETMTAILREDPPDMTSSEAAVPVGVARTVHRCLEKRPEERFQSARDLAFALETSLETSSAARPEAAAVDTRGRWRHARWLLLPLAMTIGAAAMWVGAPREAAAPSVVPGFRRLTFDRGTVREARFGPDGRSVVYSAAWEGEPLRIFMTRTDSTETVRVNVPDAQVLSVSRSGEMAISLGHRFEGWMGVGTLARASMLGGAPRPLIENVREAEWTPDGSELAIVRRADGLERLEFPIGRVLYQTSGYISHIRFSPSGDRIAFADHPLFADDSGGVSVVERDGRRTVLAEGFNSVRGVAWSPDGREVWYAAAGGGTGSSTVVFAAPLEGERRAVYSGPARYRLFDIAPDGRVLLGNDTNDRRVEARMAGDVSERDVSLRDESSGWWIAADGGVITLSDQAVAGYEAYLLRAGAASPVRLGRGQAFAMSPDGRWVAALPANEPRVLLHATGAADSRELPNLERIFVDSLAWLPDASGLVFFGQPAGRLSRGYVQSLAGGAARPFTPEGVTSVRWWTLPVAPDGGRVIGSGPDGRLMQYPLDGRAPIPIDGLGPDELPVSYALDGRELLVARGYGRPWIVDRMHLSTGRRQQVLEVRAREIAGLRLSALAVSPDGRYFVHSYSRVLSALYLVEGLH